MGSGGGKKRRREEKKTREEGKKTERESQAGDRGRDDTASRQLEGEKILQGSSSPAKKVKAKKGKGVEKETRAEKIQSEEADKEDSSVLSPSATNVKRKVSEGDEENVLEEADEASQPGGDQDEMNDN
eukprot:767384-Hanusia_phi.AAC.1